MKKKNRIPALVAGMVIALAVMVFVGGTALAEGEFAGGEGTEESPYQISTAEQLATVSEAVYLDNHYILMNDIDLSEYLSEDGAGWNDGAGWQPIGTSGTPFTGTFDGNGHSVENLFINRPGTNYIGLFSYTGSGADIRNVDLVAVDVTGAGSVGGLAGYNNGGEITACSAAGEVVGHFGNIGGLVGYNNGGTITDCSAGGSVEGSVSIGGLVGYNTGSGSAINGSWATGNVTSSGGSSDTGGLVGYNGSGTVINGSWATGNVTSSGDRNNTGGLVGECNLSSKIDESWATGNVEGSGIWNNAGGLVGHINNSYIPMIISGCYATGNVMIFGSYNNTGGLVGRNYSTNSVISGSYASGGVLGTGDNSNMGGLVGLNDGVITESQAVGSVTCGGNESCGGGLVGKNAWRIEKSKASGSVVGIGSDIQVGGLVGYHAHTIYYSYATGSVTENGAKGSGGLVGVDSGTIECSYSIGTVFGSGTIGGLVGRRVNDPPAFASFWDTQASGQSDSDGGTGKTTAEMKTYATFYDAGWDFNSIWGIDESATDPDNNGYPFLAWEGFDHKVRPAVTTVGADNITATKADVQGDITCLGYPHPTQHGVCWSTGEDPTVDDAKTQEGEVPAEGAFTSVLTGLEEETTYYVKAYVINELGTYYGEQVQFTTPALATVDIADIPGITPPIAGQSPVISITETDQYSGTVSWNPVHDQFLYETVYTATITLTAKAGYTFEGVAANFFTVAGAASVTNETSCGVVTAVFPETTAPAAYEVTFTVKDSDSVAIAGAEITINSETFTTDTDGVVTIELGNGTYLYGATKIGFHAITNGSITVNGASVVEVVVMNPITEITVTATSPDDGTTGVSLTPTITVTFNENVNADTGYGQIMLKDAGNNNINIGTSISGNVLTITPDNSLSCSTAYTVTIPAAAVKSESAGANMGEQYIFSFTTRSAPSYTVTYHANGGAGAAPTESDKTQGDTFFAAANSFTAPGGKQFKEWNTDASGTGTGYLAGATVTMSAGNLTLYAIWEDIPYVPSDNADLSGLALSQGTLTPAFNQSVTGYSASVGSSLASIDVISTTADSKATVTVNGSGVASGSAGSVSLHTGENTIIIVVTAENGMTSKTYTITVNRASSGSGGGGGGGSSSGGDGGTQTPAPVHTLAIDSRGNITTLPKLDKNTGVAAVVIDTASLTTAFDNFAETIGGKKTIAITIPEIKGAKAYECTLPASALTSTDVNKQLEIRTGIAAVTLPANMLTQETAAGAEKISLTIAQADVSGVDEETRNRIGERPVIQLSLKVDGEPYAWSNESAPVTVSIPYTPTEEELANPEHITVWYLDGEGNVVEVPNGRYEPETGTVNFSTTHFSRYAVVYVLKTFDDLGGALWAKTPIEVLASKGILKGISKNEYAPQTNITRADFLYYLIRTLGVDARVEGNFDDITEDAYYYKEIGIAKELGISSGTGDNKFCPNESITRQDMMVLTEKALRMLKKLEAQGSASDLDRFTDKSLIAAYATDSIASVVKEGLIVGSGGCINPLGNTTRAEAAAFLYRIYNK
jgi:hypothetical protein